MRRNKKERLDIGEKIYNKKITIYEASLMFKINPYTARNYMREYRDSVKMNKKEKYENTSFKKIKLIRNFYNGRDIQLKDEIELEKNCIKCLVGCNGGGKSTFIKNVIHYLSTETKEAEKIELGYKFSFSQKPFSTSPSNKDIIIVLDKNIDTKDNASQIFDFDERDLYRYWISAGENYLDRIGHAVKYIKDIIYSNKNKSLYLFFDDIDMGLSVDILEKINNVIKLIVKDCEKCNIIYYIFLSINTYYFLQFYKGIDVNNLNNISFNTYNEYHDFILKSSYLKEKLIEENENE